MNVNSILDVWTGALTVLVLTGGPFLVAALSVGVMASVFQAATQLQENVLAFAPKIIAVGLVLVVGGQWILGQLVQYFGQIGLAIESLGKVSH